MTMGLTPRKRQMSGDNLHGVRHRTTQILDQEALKRSFEFYNSSELDDLCACVSVISMQTDVEHHMARHEDCGTDLDMTVDEDGDTRLHSAIILNQPHIAMSIISKYPNTKYLSVQNAFFQSALHLSAITNQSEVCRMLLAAGAEVESRDKDGNTALCIACRDGAVNIVVCILSSNKQLQNNGPAENYPKRQDLSIRNYFGHTCLHLAAMNDHIDIVEILIENGADINVADGKSGKTILHDACVDGNLHLVKTLLRYRSCNINARTYDNVTPFDLARDRGHDHVCLALAAAGAKQNDYLSDSE